MPIYRFGDMVIDPQKYPWGYPPVAVSPIPHADDYEAIWGSEADSLAVWSAGDFVISDGSEVTDFTNALGGVGKRLWMVDSSVSGWLPVEWNVEIDGLVAVDMSNIYIHFEGGSIGSSPFLEVLINQQQVASWGSAVSGTEIISVFNVYDTFTLRIRVNDASTSTGHGQNVGYVYWD